MFPESFIHQMQHRLGGAFPDFERALRAAPPVSIRLHPHKPATQGYPHFLADVPWHPQGRYLRERPSYTLDPLFHAGAYYPQEASSMFVHHALRQLCPPGQPMRALDLCGAPGGKSTLLADFLPPGSLLVANEVIRSRVRILRENLERWGPPGLAVAQADPEAWTPLSAWFDLVLVDAPCSGEGMFRKDPDAISEWSPDHVSLCAARQQRILDVAYRLLRPGGLLLYSTCTYNRRENDDNAAWLAARKTMVHVPLSVPASWGVEQSPWGCHFYPHRVQGEGFFFSAFRKVDAPATKISIPARFKALTPLPRAHHALVSRFLPPDAGASYWMLPSGEVLFFPEHLQPALLTLDAHLGPRWFGTLVGTLKGQDLIPAHALAMSQAVHPDLPALELSREDALRFLKKALPAVDAGGLRGWVLARHAGLNLGWMKILPNRINNYLPQERRIRMDIPGDAAS